MFLGNINRSSLLILLFLFFGSVSTAFAIIGQTHYAIISLIVAAAIQFFYAGFIRLKSVADEEISFAYEIEALSKMVTFGLAPAALLFEVTGASNGAVIVGTLFLLATAVRIAHYNRPIELQGVEDEKDNMFGLPLVSIVIVLPILSLISIVMPGYLAKFLWILIYALAMVGFIVKFPIPKIPTNFKFAILALGLLAVIALIIQGPLVLS